LLVADPIADSIEVIEEDTPTASPRPDLHAQLMQAVMSLVQSYGTSEVPPAVDQLSTLIAVRDYGSVRARITEMWTEIGRFHRERGIKIPSSVNGAFNQIHSLVRRA
jgi:hypothetical protein